MTPSQFKIVMDGIDKIERRVRRVEVSIATATGAIILLMFLIQAGIVKVG
jgi:hypothetical protein